MLQLRFHILSIVIPLFSSGDVTLSGLLMKVKSFFPLLSSGEVTLSDSIGKGDFPSLSSGEVTPSDLQMKG
jgi:hypothetical protein